MIEREEKMLLAESLADMFKKRFKELIGTTPIVEYSVDEEVTTIKEVFEAVDDSFKAYMGDKKISIGDKLRTTEHVRYRNAYYSICKDFGYSLSEIGRMVDKRHCSVLHGLKWVHKGLKSDIKEKMFGRKEEGV